jgi:small subunit ribosomal protein S2
MENQKETIKQMFEIGAHYGYASSRRHPSIKPFIFGTKNSIDIFDLEKTIQKLEEAKKFAEAMASQNKTILIASSKSELKNILEEKAKEHNIPYIANRWIGGTITNFSEIQKRIKLLKDLQKQKEAGELDKYVKKEKNQILKKIAKLEKLFSGLVDLEKIPDMLFVIDSKQEKIAITEASKKNIPVVSISNSDCNISDVKHPVPANDSLASSVEFFVTEILEAYKKGKAKQEIQAS